jgi:hypothetical protein
MGSSKSINSMINDVLAGDFSTALGAGVLLVLIVDRLVALQMLLANV